MVVKLTKLENYRDAESNIIESPKGFDQKISVTSRGANNKLIVDKNARIKHLAVVFDCDNGALTIGPNKKHGFSMSVRVGQDSKVTIGRDLTTTSVCHVSAVEGATVEFGDDIMLASQNQVRSDDGHPIFDVRTGQRVNPAKNITIGSHVWLGAGASVLGGSRIGTGSVIGLGSIVKGAIPNNCVAVGTPARVVRRDIAWERPHLSFVSPPYKPDASSVEVSEEFWALTEDHD
ncbi:acyltransferase [Brevibacterium antiquum]|uniref:Transferase hexapeptide (Six repeat-containing protein) n=1 Tax=Brevibacterium antiquum TaxID=234835 RepID=A0A2H1KP72_9MICO|nr:acyltransferase [Brevibacterium antiquum]SMY01022.1 transferase hexapeptide (six repeat-containing protein) [Brevibacterium antiquum]